MALLPPVSLRGNSYVTPVEAEAPRALEEAPVAPATTDSLETRQDAELRAGQAAAIGELSPAQRGVAAFNTLSDVRSGIETRNVRLTRANAEVERLETRLGQQLMNLSPALSQDQRQAYADAYRERHGRAYGEARDAAQDLASYTRESLPRVEQALRDLPQHPHASAVAGEPPHLARAMQESVRQLGTAVRQSPTGSSELQATLQQLGTDYAQLAERAALGTRDPGNQPAPGMAATRPVLGGLGVAVGQLSREVGSLAQRAAGRFGIASGVLGAVDSAGRIADGAARTEHYVGGAAGAAQVVGGVLRVGGVAIGGPLSMAAGGAAILATAESARRDRNEYIADVSATLQAAGIASDPARAEALARSNPESLRLLAAAGYSTRQIEDLTALAPVATRMNEGQVQGLIEASQRLGLSPDRMIEVLQSFGSRAGDAITALVRAHQGNRERDDVMLDALRTGWGANAVSRRLAELVSGRR
ncbi:MAG: hypothetical protein JNK82_43470 [Myxococcaceae bacterium]|nr:hypothetical protein [Myxococcaceae bacterium]